MLVIIIEAILITIGLFFGGALVAAFAELYCGYRDQIANSDFLINFEDFKTNYELTEGLHYLIRHDRCSPISYYDGPLEYKIGMKNFKGYIQLIDYFDSIDSKRKDKKYEQYLKANEKDIEKSFERIKNEIRRSR